MNAATEAEPLDALAVTGARVHNLKNINVTIPHGRLTVITGLSGSGKSSLAFDTIFAEGQTPLHRNILELCPPDARHPRASRRGPHHRPFTRHSHRAETINRNPRSTIGTTTEIYDFLRLLYARVGTARSYISGNPMVKYSDEQIVQLILNRFDSRKILLLAPLIHNRKGHYQDLFEQLTKKGSSM